MAMSQRQYAAHRGVARSAVQRAIAEGRISTLPDGRIDPGLADREWEENTSSPNGESGKLAKVRMAYLLAKARVADLQYKRLSGELLPKPEVTVAAFNASRRIRDACLNIPSRCCGAIAGEVRRALEATGLAPDMVDRVVANLRLVEIDNILSVEIRLVLTELSDDLSIGQ